MVIWSFLVANSAVLATDHYILSLTFGLSVIMSPLTYMARNDDGLGTLIGLLVAFLSYILWSIFWLTSGMPFFFICLIILILASISTQGTAAYKALKAVD